MLFIEYPSCSTCKKAKKYLLDLGFELETRHIVEKCPSEVELTNWIKQSGLPIKSWFNTSGLIYKELNLKNKLVNMSDEEKIKLLSSQGMLIKRPILIHQNQVIVGFKETQYDLLK